MGPFPRAVMVACLTMLRWLLWLTAVLALVLVVSQYLRNDVSISPLVLVVGAVVMGGAGWICGKAARYFTAQA